MANLALKLGVESFFDLRTNNLLYVDKTHFIEEFLENQPAVATLITRPRRFGKTLLLSTIAQFLDVREDSRKLFCDLTISQNKELCNKWQNQYPVIFFTFKAIAQDNFDNTYALLCDAISSLVEHYDFLLTSDKVSEGLKAKFRACLEGHPSFSMVVNIFKDLTRALRSHYGKKVVVLIDEYDSPLSYASHYGFSDKMISIMRSMIGGISKTNTDVEFLLVTGCLRITKESIFTEVNSFVCFGIDDKRFASSLGFTHEEVQDLLAKFNLEDKLEEVKAWYDGYYFGKTTKVYCPWDLLNYLLDHLEDRDCAPKAYWANSSSDNLLKDFIERSDFNISDKIENLLAGNAIEVNRDDKINYDTLYSSENNFWNILFSTGYLTLDNTTPQGSGKGDSYSRSLSLKIPNCEVQEIFVDTVKDWFVRKIKNQNLELLRQAFWRGEHVKVEEILSKVLLNSISFYDYNESFYHATLLGIFSAFGYQVKSNLETGFGRSDLVIKDNPSGAIAIIEVKVTKSFSQLPTLANLALEQIAKQQYDAPFKDEYAKVLCYGLAFCKKKCHALSYEAKSFKSN